VYISYPRDEREFARRLVDSLSKRLPSHVRISLDGAIAGENIFVSIANRIEGADVLLLIVSASTPLSAWVRAEVHWALAKKDGALPIIPILRGPKEAIPVLLSNLTYIDFSDESSFDRNVVIISESIAKYIYDEKYIKQRKIDNIMVERDFIDAQMKLLALQREAEIASLEIRSNRIVIGGTIGAMLALFSTLIASAVGVATFLYRDNAGAISATNQYVIIVFLTVISTYIGFYFGRSSLKFDVDRRKFPSSDSVSTESSRKRDSK
jgi:hypothetical protein